MEDKENIKKVLIVGLILALLIFFIDKAFYGRKPDVEKDQKLEETKVEKVEEEEGEEDLPGEYREFHGEIKSVNEEDGKMNLLVEDQREEMIFHIDETVKIFDMTPTKEVKNVHLKKGAEISAFYPKNTPVAMSIPGQLTPQVVVVRNNEDFMDAKLDIFDQDLISSDGSLKLNIEEEGEDYKDKLLLVYFKDSTKSIPAQTNPELVLILE